MTPQNYWCFTPLDTWFFRVSRPFGAAGSPELGSMFPPPARAVMGAVKTFIHEQGGADWTALQHFHLQGPYLLRNGERLYPAPLHLLHAKKDDAYTWLCPDMANPVCCDLGHRVCLPTKIDKLDGAKPLENAWVTQTTLEKLLRGETPSTEAIIGQDKLFVEETRLGIGLDYASRTAKEGLLYQTRHLRLRDGVSVGVCLDSLPTLDKPLQPGLVRLGGEGRLAAVDFPAHWSALPAPDHLNHRRLLLMLLTPAYFGEKRWMLPGFEKVEPQREHLPTRYTFENWNTACFQDWRKQEQTFWHGELNGVRLRVWSAAQGKPLREGGWDLDSRTPVAVQSLIPPGTVWFCELEDGQDEQEAIGKLHGHRVGMHTGFGRGELAVGVWPE